MLLIKNATVYTMEDDKVLQNTDILCENGKIVKIGQGLSAAGAEVIDAAGMVATPGLIDAHTHAGGFDLNSPDLNEMTDPVTAQLDAIHAIDIHSPDFEEIHTRGVTACCLIPGSAERRVRHRLCRQNGGQEYHSGFGGAASGRHEVRHGRQPQGLRQARESAAEPHGRGRYLPQHAAQSQNLYGKAGSGRRRQGENAPLRRAMRSAAARAAARNPAQGPLRAV